MKKMILILALKSLSFPLLHAQTPKAGSSEGLNKKLVNNIKVYIGGNLSATVRESCFREINRQRQVPIEEADLYSSDYAILYEKVNQGYYIRLEKKGRLIQTARALVEYELPLAAAALAREHIPEEEEEE